MAVEGRAKGRVYIFDTTLRDAEQSPGASLNTAEKVEVAQQLARLGVDIIEAGFPVSSPVQFEAVQRVAREVKGPVIAGLARTVLKDIDAAGAALQGAPKRRIHTFTSTSAVHMEHMLHMAPAAVLAKAVEAVRHAKGYTADVEFSGQDATRSDREFLVEIIAAVIEAGATTINIPDTVGYGVPQEYGELMAFLMANVAGIEGVIVSTHCHNDLGLATANSLAGVLNGARQIECTINGLGERAGNASLEECVMAIRTRRDVFGCDTGINTAEIYRTSQLVSRLMGLEVQVNKAIVGANAFAHESGVHQDGFLKERTTYEIMRPEDVGVPRSKIVLGRHSGRHGFQARCAELGFELEGEQLDRLYRQFTELADKKKEVFDEEIIALLDDSLGRAGETFRLEFMQCMAGTGIPTATVRIIRDDGVELLETALGDGPVDAVYHAISKATGLSPTLENYSIRAVTGSTDALGEALVRIRDGERVFAGRGLSTDIIDASAKAFISALNHLAARRKMAERRNGENGK